MGRFYRKFYARGASATSRSSVKQPLFEAAAPSKFSM